jgi:hypothetical protein
VEDHIINLNLEITHESLAEARALITAATTKNETEQQDLLRHLLVERVGGRQEPADVADYFGNVLLAAISHAVAFAALAAMAEEVDISAVLFETGKALDQMLDNRAEP